MYQEAFESKSLRYFLTALVPNNCIKFQNPRLSIFDASLLQRSERCKKENWKKKAKINLGILVFFPTTHLATLNVYTNIEDWVSYEPRNL